MKAVIWTAYGPPEVLELQEVELPSPNKDQLLIKIHAATVTAGDCEMRSLRFPFWLGLPMRIYAGFLKPTRIKIIGQEFAGEIVQIGSEVKSYQVGDQVFGTLGFGYGAYAEYLSFLANPDEMEGLIARLPAHSSFLEAAAVPLGGLEALHFLRQAAIQPGEQVLINGAGGSIGTFGIQLAKYYGAEVTGVDRTDKQDLMRSVGADDVIDYTVDAFTESGKQYDVIFDVIGAAPFRGCVQSLKPTGRYLIANPRRLINLLQARLVESRSRKRVIIGTSSLTAADLDFLKELIEAGKIKPVIDRVYPLEEIVQAHRYVESGAKKGNLVIQVVHD